MILGSALAIGLSCAATAQQIISKGSWVLEASKDPTLGIFGAYPSVNACQQAFSKFNYNASILYNEALSLYNQGYEDPYEAELKASPGERDAVFASATAKNNFLTQQLDAQKEVMEALETAVCAQQ